MPVEEDLFIKGQVGVCNDTLSQHKKSHAHHWECGACSFPCIKVLMRLCPNCEVHAGFSKSVYKKTKPSWKKVLLFYTSNWANACHLGLFRDQREISFHMGSWYETEVIRFLFFKVGFLCVIALAILELALFTRLASIRLPLPPKCWD